jgi:putative DNA primase/helicase
MQATEPELSFSQFLHFGDTKKIETERWTFTELATFLQQNGHDPRDKKDGSAFNFSDYGGKDRYLKNIKSVSAAILDIDEISPKDLDTLRHKLQSFKSICYSTYSYRAIKPTARVIVPMQQQVSVDHCRELVRRLIGMLKVTCDRVSLNPNQIHYLPSRPSDEDYGHFIECNTESDFLDFEALPPHSTSSKLSKGSATDSDDRNYYDMAEQAQTSLYPDGLVYVNREFYCYTDGYWKELDVLSMQHALTRSTSPLRLALSSPAITNSLIDALKVHAHMHVFPNAEPMTVCMKNGVLDLSTGQLLAHDPAYWHLNRLEVDHSEDTECPRWLAFLEDIFRPDEDREAKIRYVQELMGYLLVPSAKFHSMAWFIGNGANGKSVLIQMMQALLGERNYSTVPLHRLGQGFTTAVLQGKLANFCSEISTKRPLEEGSLKEIVGGDAIYAEKKGKDGFSFKPYARIVAAGNTLPDVSDTSEGLSRRLTIVHFNRRISNEEMDRNLVSKLMEELGGILGWATLGLQRLLAADRFTVVPSSNTSLAALKTNSSPVASFMETAVQISNSNDRVLAKDLYSVFRAYCVENGHMQPINNSKFGMELARLCVRSKKIGGYTYYCVRLRPSTSSMSPTAQRSTTRTTLDDEMKALQDVD